MAVFTGAHFQLNQTALKEVGLPALTGSNAWAGLMGSIAIGGLIAHCIFFWGPSVVSSFKHARDKTQPDPHWVAMQKYQEAPWWWYIGLLLLAFFAGECMRYPPCSVYDIYDTVSVCVGLISVLKGETTLPVWSYIVALTSGAIVAPFSTLLFARMGSGIETVQLFKMIAGAINPGRPVANLYVGYSVSCSSSYFDSSRLFLVLNVEPRCNSNRGRFF